MICVLLLSSLAILPACTPQTDFSAQFMRYDALPNGDRVAIVQPVAAGADPAEMRAYTKLDDLEPGEVVYVKVTGRGWDEPQWAPEVAVVGRAKK